MASGPVLLTGGAGFIGREIAAQLRERGVAARALDSLNPQVHRSPRHEVRQFRGRVVVGDIRNSGAVSAAMAGCTAVVHLAAETGVAQSMYEADRYTSVNVDGTRVVLDEARRVGLPVVLASSRAVYGAGALQCPAHGRTFSAPCCEGAVPSPSRESDLLAPVSVYGRTKLAAEHLAEQFAAAGGRVVVVRPQNVIGPGPAVHNPYTGVLMAFAARLRHGLPPQVYAPGRQTRDFVAVQDVAAAIVWLLEHVEAWADCPVMNLGTGARVTLCELAALACRAAGAPVAFDLVDVLRPGDIDDACADLSLARRTGLPTPRVPLAESVRAFMAFAAEQEPVDPQIWQAALDESSGAPAGRS